jgi:hypothetical protein
VYRLDTPTKLWQTTVAPESIADVSTTWRVRIVRARYNQRWGANANSGCANARAKFVGSSVRYTSLFGSAAFETPEVC